MVLSAESTGLRSWIVERMDHCSPYRGGGRRKLRVKYHHTAPVEIAIFGTNTGRRNRENFMRVPQVAIPPA